MDSPSHGTAPSYAQRSGNAVPPWRQLETAISRRRAWSSNRLSALIQRLDGHTPPSADPWRDLGDQVTHRRLWRSAAVSALMEELETGGTAYDALTRELVHAGD